MTRKTHIVGNWKMNQKTKDINSFFSELDGSAPQFTCNAWIAPQAMHIPLAIELGEKHDIKIGAQNCSEKESGAFTGENSPASLKDIGAEFSLIGHSERRSIFNEGDELLNQKTITALNNGLTVIFCVGETLEERESDKTEEVVKLQMQEGLKNLPTDKLNKVIIAYEPVWAIGTGKTASAEQASDVHKFIRDKVAASLNFNPNELIILYGGSVKPSNVDELLEKPDIDGALVGGASLKAADFSKLCLAGSK